MITNISFILIAISFLLTAYSCSADEIYSKNRKANELYKQGKFDEALKLYEDALLLSPSDEKLKMNKGSTHFNLGEFDKAEEAYNEALSAKDKNTKADAHYNMGNILFKKAEQMQQQDLQGAQQNFKSAMDHYIKSLDLNSGDIDSKWNLQLAYQKIKELEQQQQQQNKDDKSDQKNDKKNDKKDDQKNDKEQNNNEDQQQKNKEQQQNQDDQQKDKNEQQQQQQNQNEKQQQQQQQAEQSSEQKDMKKEDARRLIELYADDADSLNKPDKKNVRRSQPEQDW